MLGSAKNPIARSCVNAMLVLEDRLQSSEGPAEALAHESARIDGRFSEGERAIFVDDLVLLLEQVHGEVGIFGNGIDGIAAAAVALPPCAMRRWRRARR